MFLDVLLLFLNVAISLGDDPLVETNVGVIKGVRATDGNYSMFLGIPYANVDPENPFGPSTPQEKFDSVFEAFNDRVMCPQLDEITFLITGTLDCLHLNIYVPNNSSSSNLLSVLVWIHGDAFVMGSASRDTWEPKYLIRHDIILVTINYRLGVYGFMCLDIPEVSGNQGMKDQVLALRWVRDNIEAFGGDPNRVTLGGTSAGGISTDFHLTSPQEKLFDKVILQSGTSIFPAIVSEPDNTVPLMIAENLGFETENVIDALNYLAKADVLQVTEESLQIGQTYNLCVEREYDDVEEFLTNYPVNLNVPKIRNTPVLMGYNDDEQMLWYHDKDETFWKELNIIQEVLQLDFNFDEEKLKEMELLMRLFYIGGEEYGEEVRQGVTNFESDMMFIYPAYRSVRKYLANGGDNIYFYVYSYNGGRNLAKVRWNVMSGGASHGDELGYLFDVLQLTEEPTTDDQVMIDRMTTMWTNFIKYGDPTPKITQLLPVKWMKVTNDTEHYLKLDSDLTAGRRPLHDRIAFLELFYKLNQKSQIGFRISDEEDDDDKNQSLYTNNFLATTVLLSAIVAIVLTINYV